MAWWCVAAPLWACTSAVVSGRVTPDGRPLLWKNRDTDFMRNHIAYVQGEKYSFIANVNSDNFWQSASLPRGETGLKEAWMGTNEAGFAIMNTQSYNLVEVKDGEERGAANGRVIYRALEVCTTVQDFCHLLDTLQKPSYIEANFGVIDAQGGALMLEVDYDKYTVFDANNPKDAPYGYVARTNFSFAGEVNQGAGYVRYMEADAVLMKASAMGGITPQGIMCDLSRSFRNAVLGVDLRKGCCNKPQGTGWFVDQDFIPRSSTSCSIVVQGVKPGERAELTTMWTLLGYPPTGVTVPLWVKGAERYLPESVRYVDEYRSAPLSARSLAWADEVFSYKQGMGTGKYLHWEKLYTAAGDGLMQQLAGVEAELFARVQPRIDAWRAAGKVDEAELKQLYAEVEDFLSRHYMQRCK